MSEFDPMKYHRPRHRNYDHYAPKLVTARNEYKCEDCRTTISKGEWYESSRRPYHTSLRGGAAGYDTIRRCVKCCGGSSNAGDQQIASGNGSI